MNRVECGVSTSKVITIFKAMLLQHFVGIVCSLSPFTRDNNMLVLGDLVQTSTKIIQRNVDGIV